jgi:hypothetical protein
MRGERRQRLADGTSTHGRTLDCGRPGGGESLPGGSGGRQAHRCPRRRAWPSRRTGALLALHGAIERDVARAPHLARRRGGTATTSRSSSSEAARTVSTRRSPLEAAGDDEAALVRVDRPGPAVRAGTRHNTGLAGRRQHPAAPHAPRSLLHAQLEIGAGLVEERGTAGAESDEQGDERCTLHDDEVCKLPRANTPREVIHDLGRSA